AERAARRFGTHLDGIRSKYSATIGPSSPAPPRHAGHQCQDPLRTRSGARHEARIDESAVPSLTGLVMRAPPVRMSVRCLSRACQNPPDSHVDANPGVIHSSREAAPRYGVRDAGHRPLRVQPIMLTYRVTVSR